MIYHTICCAVATGSAVTVTFRVAVDPSTAVTVASTGSTSGAPVI